MGEADSSFDVGAVEERPGQFKGFKTGTGKGITISEESLLKASRLISPAGDGPMDEAGSSFDVGAVEGEPGQFKGFKTGTGKGITISEESLLKASKLMSPPTKGFMSLSRSIIIQCSKEKPNDY